MIGLNLLKEKAVIMDKDIDFDDFVDEVDMPEDMVIGWIRDSVDALGITTDENGDLDMDNQDFMQLILLVAGKRSDEVLRQYHKWLMRQL